MLVGKQRNSEITFLEAKTALILDDNPHKDQSTREILLQEEYHHQLDHLHVMDVVCSRRTVFGGAAGIAAAFVATCGPMMMPANAASDNITNEPISITKEDADPTVLLRRLQEADRQLDEMLSLVDQQKFAQILATIATPSEALGQRLTQTLDQIILITPDDNVKVAVQNLRADIRAMEAAAKAETRCRSAIEQAIRDLEAVVQVAFCQTSTMVCFGAGSSDAIQAQQQKRQESMDSLTNKLLGILLTTGLVVRLS